LVKLPLKGGLNLKLSKISLTWVRISILSLLVIVAVILISRGPFIQKLLPKTRDPALTSAGQQWDLELDRTYKLCGHRNVFEQSYPSLKILKSAVESKGDFVLKKIVENRYVYEVPVEDYCPNCSSHQFLGISEKNVAVIRGTPDTPGPVLEKVEINMENLPQLELEDLRKGIPFKTSSEKLQLIEGLKSLIAN
jgi:hypothetical protein